MARTLTDHEVPGSIHQTRIEVVDDAGPGGASHAYRVTTNTSRQLADILFQLGPINEVGVNGITNENLIAIVIDRLRCFQAGDFSCRENALALTKLEEALHWLQHRTAGRVRRGVEGTSQK